MAKYISILLGIFAGVLLLAISTTAAPVANVFRSLLPETSNQYYLGTTTPSRLEWVDIITRNLTVTSGSATTTISTATSTFAGATFTGLSTSNGLYVTSGAVEPRL